jgi:hypothetical protein
MAACCLLILLVDPTKNQNKIKIAVEKLELWKEFSSRMTDPIGFCSPVFNQSGRVSKYEKSW